MADDGKILQGQIYDRQTDQVIPFTEQMQYEGNADTVIGTARTDVSPVDAHASKVRTWSQPTLTSYYLQFPGTQNISLPDVLESLSIFFNKTQGEGENIREVGPNEAFGNSGSFNFNPTASATASANIVPEAQVQIKQYWGQNVPTDNYLFYLAGNVTTADVLSRLTTILTKTVSGIVAGVVTTTAVHNLTVNQPFKFVTLVGGAGGIATATTYYVKTVPTTTTFTYAATAGGAALSGHSATSGTTAPVVAEWPRFKPEEVSLTLQGAQVNIQVSAESGLFIRWTADDTGTYGYYPSDDTPGPESISKGHSVDTGISIRTLRIPPTLHAEIVIGTETDDATCTVDVAANIPACTSPILTFGGLTNTNTLTGTATAVVTPSTITATSGYTTVPTAGLFLLDVSAQPWELGLNTVRAVLVNFNVFA